MSPFIKTINMHFYSDGSKFRIHAKGCLIYQTNYGVNNKFFIFKNFLTNDGIYEILRQHVDEESKNREGVYMKGLSENLENYLETILVLQNENTVARVKDIAEKLGVLSGTVTSALRTLSDKKLINYKPYSFITHRLARLMM